MYTILTPHFCNAATDRTFYLRGNVRVARTTNCLAADGRWLCTYRTTRRALWAYQGGATNA